MNIQTSDSVTFTPVFYSYDPLYRIYIFEYNAECLI